MRVGNLMPRRKARSIFLADPDGVQKEALLLVPLEWIARAALEAQRGKECA